MKYPKDQDLEGLENLSEPNEGAVVIRKVDLSQLVEQNKVVKQLSIPSEVSFISFDKDKYMVVPIDVHFASAEGDSVNEDGLSLGSAERRLVSLFGPEAYLEPVIWSQICRMADGGVKVLLELGTVPITSPNSAINGKLPIRIKSK